MAVWITGDIHGRVQSVTDFIITHNIQKEDVIILLGDVGLNFYGDKQSDRKKKKLLDCFGVKLLCVHGNHERRPFDVDGYHEVKWNQGTVYVQDAFPNLLFAKDGSIFQIEGKTFVAIGGAYSVDKNYRLASAKKYLLQKGVCNPTEDMLYNIACWWPNEQPSEIIRKEVETNLATYHWKVDYVLSHTCPYRFIPREAFLSCVDQSTVDTSTEQWLGEIEEKLCYQKWFCGHYHIEKSIEKMRFTYQDFNMI